MSISLYNSLKRKKEPFVPIDKNNVRMYVCGPTVYDRAHIGNARAVVVFDVLYRVLRHKYGADKVKYVRNITDVDDKINAAAKARGIDISELTKNTTQMFHDDMAALNCLAPNIEPRATEHIPEMLDMISKLIENGNAYTAEGHVLFCVSSDPKYGHLSGRSTDEMIAGARVEVAPYKEDPMDFVLWKPSSSDEPGWDSEWGRGRPGWHIECSAMSHKHLGETFDIHGGGADLTFPHHENEIAQSCCAYPGSEFAKYWVHNGFLSVEGEKMSKSLGNFVTVKDLLDKGVQGEVIRYALLATHYKKPLDWTEKALSDAFRNLQHFKEIITASIVDEMLVKEDAIALKVKFIEALYNDLNTAKAFSILHELASKNYPTTLKECGQLIGLFKNEKETYDEVLNEISHDELKKIDELITLRKAARADKNWAESDKIKNELTAMDIVITDKPDGTTDWK